MNMERRVVSRLAQLSRAIPSDVGRTLETFLGRPDPGPSDEEVHWDRFWARMDEWHASTEIPTEDFDDAVFRCCGPHFGLRRKDREQQWSFLAWESLGFRFEGSLIVRENENDTLSDRDDASLQAKLARQSENETMGILARGVADEVDGRVVAVRVTEHGRSEVDKDLTPGEQDCFDRLYESGEAIPSKYLSRGPLDRLKQKLRETAVFIHGTNKIRRLKDIVVSTEIGQPQQPQDQPQDQPQG